MERLEIWLLGEFRVRMGGENLRGFDSDKVRLLLAYLVAEAERFHRRGKLAALFWPDKPEQDARANLRRALSNLRKLLRYSKSNRGPLQITRQAVGFFHTHDTFSDVHRIQNLEKLDNLVDENIEVLEEVITGFKGEFMEGFSGFESIELEEWLLFKREQLARILVSILRRLAEHYEQRGAYQQALGFARKRVELEPWLEEGHRQVMRLLLASGQRGAALAHYHKCEQLISEALGVGLEKETVRLYSAILAGEMQETPILTPQHNLPSASTPLIGRERELRKIQACLEDAHCRLVTLVGPGGIGKTHLALEAAQHQFVNFPDGIYFVSFRQVDSGDAVPETLAEALGENISPSRDTMKSLLRYFASKRLLLVLDNFEHLVEGAAYINEIIRYSNHVNVLVTSRLPLRLLGEHVLYIKGLDVPARGEEHQAEECSAIQLFQKSALRVRPNFEINAENRMAVVELCRFLDGWPLGILLASAWVGVLTPQEILAEIQSDLDFLATDWQDFPERHRSIRAVFDHSWKMLSPQEQKVLQALAVFRNGFTRQAASVITGANLSELLGLTQKSLLSHSVTGRFYLHELLRKYAFEKLSQSKEQMDEVREKHCRYFVNLLHRGGEALQDREQQATLREMAVEYANAQLAWSWAVEKCAIEYMSFAVDGLCRYYHWQIRFGAGYRACDAARQRLQNSRSGGKERLRLLMRLMVWQAFFCWRLGRKAEANDLLVEAEELAKELIAEGVQPLAELAMLHKWSGRMVESADRATARQRYEKSLAGFRQVGDKYEQAELLSALGGVAWNLGEYRQAQQDHAESLALRQELGDLRGIAHEKMSLGQTLLQLGRFEEAERLAREGGALRREIGDRFGMAEGQRFLGVTLLTIGKYGEARDLLRDSLLIYESLGLRYGLESAMVAAAEMHLGHFRAALRWVEKALNISRKTKYMRALGYSLMVYGELSVMQKAYSLAARYFDESEKIFGECSQWDDYCHILVDCAYVHFLRGEYQAVQELFQRVGEIVNRRGLYLPVLWMLPGLQVFGQGDEDQQFLDACTSLMHYYRDVYTSRWFREIVGAGGLRDQEMWGRGEQPRGAFPDKCWAEVRRWLRARPFRVSNPLKV